MSVQHIVVIKFPMVKYIRPSNLDHTYQQHYIFNGLEVIVYNNHLAFCSKSIKQKRFHLTLAVVLVSGLEIDNTVVMF